LFHDHECENIVISKWCQNLITVITMCYELLNNKTIYVYNKVDVFDVHSLNI